MRRAARTDLAHADIRDGLRRAGYKVTDTSGASNGFPDLLVESKSIDAIFVLMEIKSVGNSLTDAEEKFHKKHMFAPLRVVYSLEGALLVMERYDKVRFE